MDKKTAQQLEQDLSKLLENFDLSLEDVSIESILKDGKIQENTTVKKGV